MALQGEVRALPLLRALPLRHAGIRGVQPDGGGVCSIGGGRSARPRNPCTVTGQVEVAAFRPSLTPATPTPWASVGVMSFTE